MTIYRRWEDMQAVLADLLVREWGRQVEESLMAPSRSLADGIVATAQALREDDLFCRIVDVDPELLLPYLLHRRGRNQDHLLRLLVHRLTAELAEGRVRAGEPEVLARALLLAVQGFVVSAATMADVSGEALDEELRELVVRYLRP